MQIGNLMKQAQQIQAQMAEIERQIDALEETGQSGSGLVQVTLDGNNTLLALKIDPSIVDGSDTEMLEDLITAAFHDAQNKINKHVEALRSKLSGPKGMKLPF